LVHPHWLDGQENFEETINDVFIKFVQSIGGIPHPHSSCDHGQDFVWDVRPLIDSNESDGKPARSLTADAFEMHTVSTLPSLIFLPLALALD
jgi:hypothetical protein